MRRGAQEKGRESVKKGRRFEDEIAALYRLMGYTVRQNIEICQKKVDILASYRLPGTQREHHIIVECKDEITNRGQNQRVMEFKGFLEMAQRMRQADSAEIVTRKPWSDQAKGFAHSAGIALYTFEEKLRDIIDFSHYIERVIYDFEHFEERVTPTGPAARRPIIDLMNSTDLHRTYVPPVCRFTDNRGKSREMEMDKYLDKWLADPHHNYLSILGDFGTGKSSFCLHLAYTLAKRYRDDPINGRIPLFISLRDYAKAVNLQQLITDLLLNKYDIRVERYAVFERFLELGHLILIFDGFDEMTTKTDRTDTIRNFEELTKAAVTGSKTILTCRTHYFRDQRHMTDIFGTQEQSELLLAVRGRVPAFQMVELQEFSDAKIQTFLYRQRPDDWKKIWVAIQRNLRDLARRPLLLDMIVRSPDLDQVANIARLYDVYTQLWIKRGDFQARMNEEGKHAFMRDLATEMWLHDRQSIHYNDLEGRVQDYFVAQIRTREDLDYFDHDTRTCSFLNRDPQGNYGFIHQSFMEFFVAKKIAEALCTNTIDSSFRERAFSPEISSFVAQLAAADLDALATLCAWAFDEKSTLSWNAIGIVSFLKSFDPEPVVEQLVRLSKNNRPRSGIIWVLGELGVTKYGVLELLHCTLNDTKYGSRGAWWESAFALEKVEGVKDPVGALIEKLPPEWTFAKALEHLRQVVEVESESERMTSSDLPDLPTALDLSRISVDQRAVVAVVREYRKGGRAICRTQEAASELFSSLDLSCDIMDRRAYHAIWLLGELRVSSALPRLLRAVDHPQSPVRNMLAEAIGKIGPIAGNNRSIDLDRECLSALKKLLVDKYYRVRFHAAQAVGNIRAVALLTELKQALDCEPMRDVQNEMLKTVRVLEAHLAGEQ
jgi:hypothetical protein